MKLFEKIGTVRSDAGLDLLFHHLQTAIAGNPFLWDMEDLRSTYPGSSHKDSQTIILRAGKQTDIVAAMADLRCFWRPEVAPLWQDLEPIFKWICEIAKFGAVGRVMLTKLAPGGRIEEHQDEGHYATTYDRVHLCIQGQEGGNIFTVKGERFFPVPGAVYWLNHKQPHSVANDGSSPRIHLIVDGVSPEMCEWRGIYCQRETFAEATADIHHLLFQHWREIARYQDIPLEPDWIRYDDMEKAGTLRFFTCREGPEMIGYALFIVSRGLHYDYVQAQQDILFVHPDFRRGRIGVNLIRYAEGRLRAEGVQVIIHHVKTTNSVGRLLERMGYEEVDKIYLKRLR